MTTFEQYEEQAVKTDNRSVGLEMPIMGLIGEVGELAEIVKKHRYHGQRLSRKHVQSELGDILWYLTAVATRLDISLESIASQNIQKLAARYPGGFVEGGGIRIPESVSSTASSYHATITNDDGDE